MTKAVMALLSGAAVVLSACSYNIAVKEDSDRIYLNTNIKQVTMQALRAVKQANLSVKSTNNPVDGMVIITAEGGRNSLIQNEPATLTLTLSEIEPTRIRVEASAIQPGQMNDYGITKGMINDVFKVMDSTLTPAGSPPRKQNGSATP